GGRQGGKPGGPRQGGNDGRNDSGSTKPPDPPPGQNSGNGSTGTGGSIDPNEKTGPAGVGPRRYVATVKPFAYRIDFENDARATAPAQRAESGDQLAPELDWNSVQLTEVAWGNIRLTVPPNSRQFQTVVPMTYNGQTFDVYVDVGLRTQTGQLYATFQSVDP